MVLHAQVHDDLLQLLDRRDYLLLLSSEKPPDARQLQRAPAHVAMHHRVLVVAAVTYDYYYLAVEE